MARHPLGLGTTPILDDDDPLRPAIGAGQRWLAIGVGVLAAAHLLLISPAWKGSADDRLSYAPTARQGSANPVTLLIDADTLVPVTIHLDADTVTAYDMARVQPNPDIVRLENGGMTLVFGQQRSGPLDLHMDMRPRRLGWAVGQVKVEGGEIRTLNQLVGP